MGGGQSTLSPHKVLERCASSPPGEQAVGSLAALSDDEIVSRLAKLGVTTPRSDVDPKVLRTALAAARDPRFWVTNYEIHPNGGRVKNWLWVHNRYRNYCDELVEKVEGLAAASEAERPVLAKQVLLTFNKFVKQVTRHSLFEDEQLFKYFGEQHDVDFGTLKQQHSDLRTTESVLEELYLIGEGRADEVAMKKLFVAVRALNKEFHEHLTLEEDTIITLWLNLTNQEYRKYRSYLSWVFAAMY